jgi:hypothetical protein
LRPMQQTAFGLTRQTSRMGCCEVLARSPDQKGKEDWERLLAMADIPRMP